MACDRPQNKDHDNLDSAANPSTTRGEEQREKAQTREPQHEEIGGPNKRCYSAVWRRMAGPRPVALGVPGMVAVVRGELRGQRTALALCGEPGCAGPRAVTMAPSCGGPERAAETRTLDRRPDTTDVFRHNSTKLLIQTARLLGERDRHLRPRRLRDTKTASDKRRAPPPRTPAPCKRRFPAGPTSGGHGHATPHGPTHQRRHNARQTPPIHRNTTRTTHNTNAGPHGIIAAHAGPAPDAHDNAGGPQAAARARQRDESEHNDLGLGRDIYTALGRSA